MNGTNRIRFQIMLIITGIERFLIQQEKVTDTLKQIHYARIVIVLILATRKIHFDNKLVSFIAV